MPRRTRIVTAAAVLGAWVGAWAADPPYYARKATWQQTMQAAREALLRWEAKQAKAKAGVKPTGKAARPRLGPWYDIGPFTARDSFKQAFAPEKEIALTKRYGKLAWRGRNWQDGKVHALRIPSNSAHYFYRKITAAGATSMMTYYGSDDGLAVWLNGKNVISKPVPRGVSANQDRARLTLRAGDNHLLIKIWNRGGHSGWYFSTSAKAGDKLDPRALRRAALWDAVRRDFSSAEARRQMDWERGDRIWTGDWKPGDIGELARRYVGAARGTRMAAEIDKLAKTARTPAQLDRIRSLYYRAKGIQQVLAKMGDLNFTALRLAVRDLMQTFGAQYPKGADYLRRLDEIEKGLVEAGKSQEDKLKLTERFLRLRREALLANPLLDFDKLLVVRRSMSSPRLGLPQNWQGNCALPRSGYDNEIALLDMSDLPAPPKRVYRPQRGRFVGDVDLHFDGKKMLFSSTGDKGRWQIFEIGVDGRGLRQVTPGEYKDVDNYDACYLPDGRIVFASTRCFQGVPCVGGGNQVANLFLLDPQGGSDGVSIRRLTFDQDHNWCPTVLPSGRVMYSRWEYSDTPHYFSRLLFHMNPDGTQQMELYGSNSYWPNSIFYARPVPNHPTKLVAVISGHHGVPRMGELVVFDPARGRHEADGAVQRIPGYGKPVEPIIRDGLVNGSWPKFLHPWPLSDKYFLVSCRPRSSDTWDLYLADVFDNLLLLRKEPGYALFEPVPLRKTPRPPAIPDKVNLARRDAVVYLSDVYRGPGLAGVPRGTVKKLRLYEFHYAYYRMGGHINIGIDGPWDVHQILGTVDVGRDGSALFRVPANRPIAVQPLDEEGKALQIMRSWFTAMPGEILSCVGCHERQNETTPNRRKLASLGRPQEIQPWYGPVRGFSFKREVQPVLDTYCVSCHDGSKTKNGRALPDFRRTDKRGYRGFTPSYLALHRYVRRPGPESDYHIMPPLEYHADGSELVQMLRKGHGRVKLSDEAWDRLITWIDLNVPDHGTWSEYRKVSGNIRERRLEMYRRYAHVYQKRGPEEIVPAEVSLGEAVQPAPPPSKPAPATAPGWPFDADEAKRRQFAAAKAVTANGNKPEMTVELPGGGTLELVLVPPGQFVMGDLNGWPDEWPQSRVRIAKPFWMGKFEVTNAQYAAFDAAHDSRYISVYNKDQGNRGQPANKDRQPVIRVSWRQAMAFCRWLSRETGRRFALPTEAQWEYACRAGTATAMSYGSCQADFAKHANFADSRINSLCRRDSPKWIPCIDTVNDGSIVTDNVGKYRPNAWGLHDMHGNVAEWTRTTYRAYPYDAGDGRDNPTDSGRKVVRGGSFYDRPQRGRSAFRLDYPSWRPVYKVGFRVACEVDAKSIATSSSRAK